MFRGEHDQAITASLILYPIRPLPSIMELDEPRPPHAPTIETNNINSAGYQPQLLRISLHRHPKCPATKRGPLFYVLRQPSFSPSELASDSLLLV